MGRENLYPALLCILLNIQLVLGLSPSPTSKDNLLTTTTSPASVTGATFLYLPVSADPPDPLGIAAVSSVYGPGTWAAWFISVCVSWWKTVAAHNSTIDPNFWLFVLGIWWAAVDLTHRMWKITARDCNSNGGKAAAKDMGALAAAFTVLWVGVMHGVFMLWLSHSNFVNSHSVRRPWVLCAALIFPVASFIAFGVMINLAPTKISMNETTDMLPVTYWRGVGGSWHRIEIFLIWSTLSLDAFLLYFRIFHEYLITELEAPLQATRGYFSSTASSFSRSCECSCQ
jgi:hypothetical protein